MSIIFIHMKYTFLMWLETALHLLKDSLLVSSSQRGASLYLSATCLWDKFMSPVFCKIVHCASAARGGAAPLPQAATRAMPRRQSRRRWRPPSPWCRRGLSCSGSPSAGHGARHAAAYIYDAEASKLEERSPQHAAARRTVRRPPAAASSWTASAAATPASSIRTSTLCPKFCKTCPTILRPFIQNAPEWAQQTRLWH